MATDARENAAAAATSGTQLARFTPMGHAWLTDRAAKIVRDTLDSEDAELERMLVGDAIVFRTGNHYRIESGGDLWEELERSARVLSGECDCGGTLSASDTTTTCRTCGRSFPRH